MPASQHLIDRTADLKAALIDLATTRRYEKRLNRLIMERFGEDGPPDEIGLMALMDDFILLERQPDGRTLVEHYLDAHPELPEEDREMLRGWRVVVDGIFEVQDRERETIVLHNLVDELTYRARANVGPSFFRQMPPGSFVVCRLVPLADEWVFSGSALPLDKSQRPRVMLMAYQFIHANPEAMFRNPEKLALAWELQCKQRQMFIDFFGADTIVVAGDELVERMGAFSTSIRRRILAERGESVPDSDDIDADLIDPTLEEFIEFETVGVMYDVREGLNIYPNYGAIQQMFADPRLADQRHNRQIVEEWLKERESFALPLRRLAAEQPEAATEVFRRALRRPSFDWERDGEKLLRRGRSQRQRIQHGDDREPLPSVLPVPDAITEALRDPTPAPGPAPLQRVLKRLKH